MIDICLEQLSHSCRKLETICYRQNMAIEQLAVTINRIQAFSPMEHLVAELRKEKSDLEKQNYLLRRMTEALDRTILSYQRTEDKIVEHAEEGTMVYRYFSGQLTDVFSNLEQRIPFIID